MGDACWKVFENDVRNRFQKHAFAHVTAVVEENRGGDYA